MNSRAIRRLTATILSRQMESGRHGTIDEKRLREALTIGPQLTEKENSLLLLSPVARDDWNRIRTLILNDMRDKIAEQGLDTSLVSLAASTDIEDGQVLIPGSDFSVTLYRQDTQGIPWVILVQLGPAYRNTIYPMTCLRLVDEGGLEWMRGYPDAEGEITSAWLDRNLDLHVRARKYSLKLEPV